MAVDGDSGLDFKWINPTRDYVLIQSSTTADKVTFSLYGTKPDWKVQVDPPQITNRVAPDTTPDVEPEPREQLVRVAPHGGGSHSRHAGEGQFDQPSGAADTDERFAGFPELQSARQIASSAQIERAGSRGQER